MEEDVYIFRETSDVADRLAYLARSSFTSLNKILAIIQDVLFEDCNGVRDAISSSLIVILLILLIKFEAIAFSFFFFKKIDISFRNIEKYISNSIFYVQRFIYANIY